MSGLYLVRHGQAGALQIDSPLELDYDLSREQCTPQVLSRLVSKLESQVMQYPEQWEKWIGRNRCGDWP